MGFTLTNLTQHLNKSTTEKFEVFGLGGELIRGRFGATPSPLPAVNLVIIPSALTLFLYLECCIVVVFGLSNHSFLLQGMGKVAVGSRSMMLFS